MTRMKIGELKVIALVLLLGLSSCSRQKDEITVRIVPAKGGKSYLVLPKGRELKLPLELNHSEWRKIADEEGIFVGDGSTWFPSLQKGGQNILILGEDTASELRLKTNSGTGTALIDRRYTSGRAVIVELR